MTAAIVNCWRAEGQDPVAPWDIFSSIPSPETPELTDEQWLKAAQVMEAKFKATEGKKPPEEGGSSSE